MWRKYDRSYGATHKETFLCSHIRFSCSYLSSMRWEWKLLMVLLCNACGRKSSFVSLYVVTYIVCINICFRINNSNVRMAALSLLNRLSQTSCKCIRTFILVLLTSTENDGLFLSIFLEDSNDIFVCIFLFRTCVPRNLSFLGFYGNEPWQLVQVRE
jgi:hypothetical protein